MSCSVEMCWCVEVLVPWKHWRSWNIVGVFRSGRISSVYIVGRWSLVVGHTFSKFVNFEFVGMLECAGVLEC